MNSSIERNGSIGGPHWRCLGCLVLGLAMSVLPLQRVAADDNALARADAHYDAGRLQEALAALEALEAAEAAAPARLDLRLARVHFAAGRYEQAEQTLERSAAAADTLSAAEALALKLEQGHLAGQLGRPTEQAALYGEAAAMARAAGRRDQQLAATINLLRGLLDARELVGFDQALDSADQLIASMREDRAFPALAVSLGDVLLRARDELAYGPQLEAQARALFDAAAARAGRPADLGYALGYLGLVAERAGEVSQALDLTNRAIFQALEAEDEAQLYLWEWQAGRLMVDSGALEAGEQAYARAVQVLAGVRGDLPPGAKGFFARRVQPLYTEYADIMLRRIGRLEEGAQKQQRLRNVRSVLETLKRAEVEDYFEDQCLVADQAADDQPLADASTAVIYPVFLDDRIELVVEVGGNFAQFTTPVGRDRANRSVRRLRVNLERYTSESDYLAPARELYGWLIAPLAPFLESQSVRTLVIVPEGSLRTIPLAALHDGEQFLVQRYAIGTTPGIDLISRSSTRTARQGQALIAGLTESVQGFAGLPNVQREIDTIASMYRGTAMRDDAFRLDAVTSELQEQGYSIAHFATHGEFSRNPRDSFILTYDDRFTMNALRDVLGRRQREPLDLLVLSACKTAAGDDRAALGLAGVAVQSGAESAVASLWYISDQAASELVSQFYANVSAGGVSKAQGLRLAQMRLIEDERFRHPSYWAPFLLIGNWN